MTAPSAPDFAAPDPSAAAEHDLARQLARSVWFHALVAGVGAQSFGWDHGAGLNIAFYLATVALATASVLRFQLGSLPTASSRLLQLAALAALLIAFRDAPELAFLNFCIAGGSIALALAASSQASIAALTCARIRDAFNALVTSGIGAAFGGFAMTARLLSSDGDARRPALVKTLRLSAIAVMIIASFGTLLAAGDPVFHNALRWMFEWNTASFGERVFIAGLCAWPVLGLFWVNIDGLRSHLPAPLSLLPSVSIRSADVKTALWAMNAVFLAFVLLQARVLFGGQEYVLATTGLSLADYARNGFFVLVFTAGLVLSMLLAFNALLENGVQLHTSSLLQRLSFAMLVQVGIVLASAGTRMTVYMNAYGASLERVYCMVIIAWLAITLVWFAMTVLRGNSAHFFFGSASLAVATIVALNVMNPHVLVARNHIARAERGERYDANFLATQLGADAVPILVTAIERDIAARKAANPAAADVNSLCANSLCSVIPTLQRRWKEPEAAQQFGRWTFGYSRARAAVKRLPAVTPVAATAPSGTTAPARPESGASHSVVSTAQARSACSAPDPSRTPAPTHSPSRC
ncbi:MAG: DUF4153 domain-containing protein [Gemmatimonas sp.]